MSNIVKYSVVSSLTLYLSSIKIKLVLETWEFFRINHQLNKDYRYKYTIYHLLNFKVSTIISSV